MVIKKNSSPASPHDATDASERERTNPLAQDSAPHFALRPANAFRPQVASFYSPPLALFSSPAADGQAGSVRCVAWASLPMRIARQTLAARTSRLVRLTPILPSALAGSPCYERQHAACILQAFRFAPQFFVPDVRPPRYPQLPFLHHADVRHALGKFIVRHLISSLNFRPIRIRLRLSGVEAAGAEPGGAPVVLGRLDQFAEQAPRQQDHRLVVEEDRFRCVRSLNL